MLEKKFSKDHFKRLFPNASASRQAAFSAFQAMPLPSPKLDAWRYTDLRRIDFTSMASVGNMGVKEKLENASVQDAEVNADTPGDKMQAFMQAFSNGRQYSVEKNTKARLNILFKPSHSGAAWHVVKVGENATADVFLQYESKKAVLFGERTVFKVGAGATLNVHRVQIFGEKTASFCEHVFEIGKSATVNGFHAELGGGISRTIAEHRFLGDNASAPKHHAVLMGSKKQHLDLTTIADHQARGTQSDVIVKGALRTNATCVYRGVIRIAKNARQTSSFLQDRMLHLDTGVSSQSIPSLFIDNNDVRASHGATVSKLSPDALFYLQSRGLPRKKAEKLVVDGFLKDGAAGFPDALQESIFKAVDAKLME